MRTRNQCKQKNHSSDNSDAAKALNDESGTLAEISREAVGKLLRRANPRRSSGIRKLDSCSQQCESTGLIGSKRSEILDTGGRVTWNALDSEGCGRSAIGRSTLEKEVDEKSSQDTYLNSGEDINESDWEEGSIPTLDSVDNHQNAGIKEVTIELSGLLDSSQQKPIRRASAEDKELAELVHKVHLLCLLARGRLIDSACNDPLVQASLLSLLPADLLKISEIPRLTANAFTLLVRWFHDNFRVRSPSSVERPLHSSLAFALEAHEGTPEEVAALSVALFRALNLTTRFVSILDVAPLKPGADKSESAIQNANRASGGIFDNSTLMVARKNQVSSSPVKSSSCHVKGNVCEPSQNNACTNKDLKSTRKTAQSTDSPISDQLNDRMLDSLACKEQFAISEDCITDKPEGSKRKGDLEFKMQLEMALSATAVGINESNGGSNVKELFSESSSFSSPLKRVKRIKIEESPTPSQGISTAVGSRKIGAPLYWAEVFCTGENLTGKWVHIDAINAIIDGEEKVEAAAAACKTSLRYVVAFSGNGAKDVTRRYCMKWYRIASQRINSAWWDAVLAPLKELEAGAVGDHVTCPGKLGVEVLKENVKKVRAESSDRNAFVATRDSLEDMELETRALTEPLPTNQQAYKNHQLYAMERWLTKYQILHPKGPVLGFCSGHPVYPRTCVQTLKTKQRWLREGLQVKADEHPTKVLKCSSKLSKVQALEAVDYGDADPGGTIALYGRWQMEPLCLPCAVNGIVPKNEWGQVDVWSEKCLPPGTVHLRVPRVVPIAKKLEIDFAPAMVGFEFRNGRSIPVFDGIVVCAEFKDTILEVYADEEERRQAEEKRGIEAHAVSRWYQLLSSIVIRQRLNNSYGNGLLSDTSNGIKKVNNRSSWQVEGRGNDRQFLECQQGYVEDTNLDPPSMVFREDHEHVFIAEEGFDEENLVRTKRCGCGFSIQVEEL